jgi:hypothetical protein
VAPGTAPEGTASPRAGVNPDAASDGHRHERGHGHDRYEERRSNTTVENRSDDRPEHGRDGAATSPSLAEATSERPSDLLKRRLRVLHHLRGLLIELRKRSMVGK